MKFSELVGIAKLGKLEADGFFHILYKQSYKAVLLQLKECFLVFSRDRVFFVTVRKRKTAGNRLYFSFLEDGIAEEYKKSKQVTVALPQDDFESPAETLSVYDGFTVYSGEEKMGKVISIMENYLQNILVVELNDGRELLVPDVPHYVQSVDKESRIIRLQNIEQLLEL